MKTSSDFPFIAFIVLAILFLRMVELKAQHPILGNPETNTCIKAATALPTATAESVGTNTEQSLLGFEASLLGIALDLSENQGK